MSEHGLIAKGTRKYYRYQANKNTYDEKENILNQVFKASQKNQIWVGDITYIPTKHAGFIGTESGYWSRAFTNRIDYSH